MKVKRFAQACGAVLAAGAAGAGLALLFAPHSGDWTRRLIRRKTEDVGHDVHEFYGRVKETGGHATRRFGYRLKMRLTPKSPVGSPAEQKAQ